MAFRNGMLDIIASVIGIYWTHLYAKRRGHGLYNSELADPRGYGRIPKDRGAANTRRNLFK